MKKIILLLTVISGIVCLNHVETIASEEIFFNECMLYQTQIDRAVDRAASFAETALDLDSTGITTKILYDFNDQEKYILVNFSDKGYVIVDMENRTIIEAAGHKNDYIAEDEKIYYNGPLAYYILRDKKAVDQVTGEIFNTDDIVPIKVNDITGFDSEITPYGNVDYTAKISGVVPNYSYNPTGICGSTAAAMWLMYMDTYVNGNYVPTNLESSTGVTLINTLIPYIDGTLPGSDYVELKNGLQQYLYSRKITSTISTSYWNATLYKNKISANQPMIIGLAKHPTYGDHWIVGYGYYVERDPNVAYIIVNDGHGATGVNINPAYVDYIVYQQ